LIKLASAVSLTSRRKLRPTFWPVSRNVIIACAGLCGVALTPHSAFAQSNVRPSEGIVAQRIDADSEILVAMNATRYRLADDITAAPVNDGLCVDVQQVFGALDFPIIVDRSRQIASGWFINESRNFTLDLRTGAAEVAGVRSIIKPEAMGTLSTGACVTTDALGSLLGISIEYAASGSLLTVSSVQKLPLLERLERQSRESVGRISLTQEGIMPRLQSLPYRAFVAPNTDVSIALNRHQGPETNNKIDATWNILSIGELAYMTAEAQVGGTEAGVVGDVSRLKLYRTERDGGVFGYAKLTEFSVGDITANGSSLGANGGVGFGLSASSFPLNRPTSFDKTSFEGALPAGWDVELYHNGQLLEFRNDGTTGGYSFRDVPVLFGENSFQIVQYGPQGQRRVINRQINASNFLAPKGDHFYRAAVYRPEVLLGRRLKGSGIRVDFRSAFGIAENLNIGAGFDSYVLANRRLSVGTISALTSVSGIALNAEISATSEGSFAGQIEFQATGKGASMRGRVVVAQEGFRSERFTGGLLTRIDGSADRAFVLPGQVSGTLSGRLIFDRYYSNETLFSARQRMTLSHGNAWLAQSLTWTHSSSGERRDNIEGEFSYSMRRGLRAVRASVEYDIYPTPRVNRLSASVERSFAVRRDAWRWQLETGWIANERKFSHRFAIGREFGAVNLDMVAESDGDSQHRVGLNLSFSLGRRTNGWGITSVPLASSGTVRAQIFEDMDDNGIFSAGDVPVARAGVVANGGRDTSTTDDRGYAVLDSVTANQGTQINVLTDDLDDPNLYARSTYTKAREGTVSEISIPLTQMGSIEGTVEIVSGFDPKSSPLGGVTLVLLNGEQKEIGRTTSAYDGYYSFDLVPVGSYRVVLAPDTSLARRFRPITPLEVVTSRTNPGVQGRSMTLIETNPTSTRMALRGLL
jgi:hypothetical protein